LVARVGVAALNRRLAEKVAKGGTSYLNARVGLGNQANAIYTATISGRANPGKWQATLEEIAMELQRARTLGVTAHGVEDVKKELISGAERAVETEATTQASQFVSRINGNVSDGEPTRSAQQRLDLLKETLPSITLDEVSKRFAKEFDPSAVAFVATLP